jgi:thermitase
VDTVSIQNVYSASVPLEISFVMTDSQVVKTITGTLPAASGRIVARPTNFIGVANINTQWPVHAVNFALEESGNDAYLGVNVEDIITIAVIDTGVDLDHPDLVENLLPGYDFVDEDTQPQDTSADSHGAKVAGIIAARMNNDLAGGKARGIVGIGGGNTLSNTLGLRILPLRVAAESTSVDCALSARAIDYAVDQGARIINISYGSKDFCPDGLASIQRAYAAGLVIVAGAGNDNSSEPFYPAAYGAGENEDLVLAIAGLDANGAKAYHSNYGEWIDFGAPYNQLRTLTRDGGYASDSGTSYSAPLVSGLLGLLMSNYGWSRDKAVQVLRDTADPVDLVNEKPYQGLLGSGRINAARASENQPLHTFLPIISAAD